VYAAWFADPELAAYFKSPTSTSVTGAAVAARLRREGYDWRERVRALSTPVLVIHGERDALPVAVSTELVELLPRALQTLLPDAGHMPFWEAPAPFFGAVTAFLDASTVRPRR
jgi:proline iminopeptidase